MQGERGKYSVSERTPWCRVFLLSHNKRCVQLHCDANDVCLKWNTVSTGIYDP